MELVAAWGLASEFIGEIALVCDRVSIAGSIRRRKPDVRDIEVVAIPKTTQTTDMFGNVTATLSSLDGVDWSKYGSVVKNGSRYKQIALHQGISLDLFIVLPPNCKRCGRIFSKSTTCGEDNALQRSRDTQGKVPTSLSQSGLSDHPEELRGMRGGVRDGASSRAENMQQEMLWGFELEDARCERGEAGKKLLQGSLQELRQAVPDQGIQSTRSLLDQVRETGVGKEQKTEEAEVEKVPWEDRMDTRKSDRRGIYTGLSSRTPPCGKERSDMGAPAGDGKSLGALSGAVGKSTSPQWNKDGQPDRKFRDSDPCTSKRVGGLSTLQTQVSSSLDDTCPFCKTKSIVRPQWGVLLAIRTGPADFSQWLVTPKVKGGLLPAGLRVQFGGVYRGVELIPTLEETDLFELLELPYIPPEARCAQWSR